MASYCLGDLGFRYVENAANDWSESKETFVFNKKIYHCLLFLNEIRRLITETKKSSEFTLVERTNYDESDKVYLSIFMEKDYAGLTTPRINILNILLEYDQNSVLEYDTFTDTTDDIQEQTPRSVKLNRFYEKLRISHAATELSVDVDVQHKSLFPVLRPYQIASTKWMYHMETCPRFIPTEFIPAKNRLNPDTEYFINPRTLEVLKDAPEDTQLPLGGILADEMGLGKTVEILSLILINRKSSPNLDYNTDKIETIIKTKSTKVHCICINKKNKEVIQCSKCLRYQHRACILKNSTNIPKIHICPECFRNEKLTETGATIIVSPAAIKMQWESEIKKHINDNNFKVLVYNGVINSGWISPYDMAEYDVIITDYNVLKAEIHFTETNSREGSLRHSRKYMNPVSPLPLIKWWRVCLDEAQMVETASNQCSKMVKTLTTVHRWGVSGTPVEKNINSLYGLVYFLNYEPFMDINIWKKYSNAFNQGDDEPLVNMMTRVMWRTCKSKVLTQINIPQQTELIHYIEMSDLQQFFYIQEYRQCIQTFKEKIKKMGNDLALQGLSPQVMNVILEPLRKLRQDCVMPSVCIRSLPQSSIKRTLTPAELYEHLESRTENDCKSSLRAIVCSLNGIAALYILMEDIPNAIKYYNIVLRWVKDYNKGPICVDSLLQIHTLHNLSEIMQQHNIPSLSEARKEQQIDHNLKECARLEEKFLKTQKDVLQSAVYNLRTAAQEVAQIVNFANDGRWWRAAFYSEPASLFGKYFEKLTQDISLQSRVPKDIFISPRTLDFVLTTWLDKVKDGRMNIQQDFQNFDYIIYAEENNTDVDKAKLNKLAKSAFECHINTEKETPEIEIEEELCSLCKLKNKLGQYECLIFSKKMNYNTRNLQGSWNPTYEEDILRHILVYVRNRFDAEIVDEATKQLEWLDAIKEELKEYNKLWMETNYMAAVYDELNMCRTRLSIYDPQIDDNPNSNLKVLKDDLDVMLNHLMNTKITDEKSFVRLTSLMKYLKHLKNNKEEVTCPICRLTPEGKYAVLQCGHNICLECLVEMTKLDKKQISCAICRNQQTFASLFYVTPEKSIDDNISIVGSYSSKIDEIIFQVLKLKAKEEDVKIIIFSQWENILSIIAKGLEENSVLYRLKSAKFHVNISEFKDDAKNVTCLLLPLKFGSKGLNLIEATHVFLAEPILNTDEELQAIGRVHRIGQTKPTFVHKFIMKHTVEENIHRAMAHDDSGKWKMENMTIQSLLDLLYYEFDTPESLE